MKRFKKALALLMAMIMVVGAVNLPVTTAKAAENVTLGLASASIRSTAAGQDRDDYLIYLKGLTEEQVAGLTNTTISKVLVNGKARSNVTFYKISSDGGHMAITPDGSWFESADKKPADLGRHFLTIPKGAMIGGTYEVSQDFTLYINGANKPTVATNLISFTVSGSRTRKDDYQFDLQGLTETQLNGVATAGLSAISTGDVLIDGKVPTTGKPYFWNGGSGTLWFMTNYSHIKDGAASAADITEEHLITIQKGTKIGTFMVEHDLNFKVHGTSMEWVTVKPTLSIASASSNSLLLLKADEIETPAEDQSFTAVDSDSVFQYNGEDSKRPFIYSKHGGIYADVSGMKGVSGVTAQEGDVITIKGRWKYAGDRKVYDFGNTNYTWNGTEWVKGLIVDATPVTFTILQPTRTDLLLLKINDFPYDGETVAKDTYFEALDENSVYQFNGTDLSIQPHFAYAGLYNTVQSMAGRKDAEVGDTVVIGGVWKHLYDGAYYDFGDPKTYKWNASSWVEDIPIVAIKPTLSVSSSAHSGALILDVAEIALPSGDKPFQAYENTIYTYYDASSDTTTPYGGNLVMSKWGLYVTPMGDNASVAQVGDIVTIGGIWKYSVDDKYYDFGEGTAFEFNGSKWTAAATPMTFSAKSVDKRQNDWIFYVGQSAFTVAEEDYNEHGYLWMGTCAPIVDDGTSQTTATGAEVYAFKESGNLGITITPKQGLLASPAAGTKVIFPVGLTITYNGVTYKLAKNFVYRYDGSKFVEEVQYTDFTLAFGSEAKADDPNSRYFIYTTGVKADWAEDMHQKTATIYVDDTPVEDGVEFWNDNGTLLLLFKYDKIESGVQNAADLSAHNISIKAGTKIATYNLKEDFEFYVEQSLIEEGYHSMYPTVSLGWGTGSEQNDSVRYLFYPAGATEEQVSALHGKSADAYIDGKLVTGAVSFHNDNGTLLMLLPYDKLEAGVNEAVKLSPHSIVIKRGTIIDDKYQLAADYKISVDGSAVKNTEELTEVNMHMSMTEKSAAQDYYDAGKTSPAQRYLLYFEGFNATSIADIHTQPAKITVDGSKRVADGSVAYHNLAKDDKTITMILPYTFLEEGVTECAQFAAQHSVTIKKGTILADKYIVGEDLTIPLNKDQIMHSVVDNAVTTTVQGTELTIGGTGTIKASDLAGVTAANITKIKIEGPCDIASKAFVGFTSLQEVYFSNTVLTAADDAFSGCKSGVKAIYVKDRELTGGLESVDAHEYYSFKIVTIGSSFGEDTNNYIYTLAKQYYSNLPGRTAEDIGYDDIVVAELFTGGGTLVQRVTALMGLPVKTDQGELIHCWYEKWDKTGTHVNTGSNGPLSRENMTMALQDEYWDIVILMQGAEETKRASTFLIDTEGKGRADIDTMIDFVKTTNKNNSGSRYLWLQTFSYNHKLNSAYASAVQTEQNERAGIVESMKTVIQPRVDAGTLDGILPVGAAIEYLKTSWLYAEDPNYVKTYNNGTYNEGNYSNYFAIQRDVAHASIGLGRFSLGLTAIGYLAGLDSAELQALANECYPQNYVECEVSKKLEGEQSATHAYLKYDENTKDCAPQAYSAAIKALADPYMEGNAAKVYKTGDANGDDVINSLDLIRYKKAQTNDATIADDATADINMDGTVDAADLTALRDMFVWDKLK